MPVKDMPSKSALKKMDPEKRRYWENRIQKRKWPMLNKLRAIQYLSARNVKV